MVWDAVSYKGEDAKGLEGLAPVFTDVVIPGKKMMVVSVFGICRPQRNNLITS